MGGSDKLAKAAARHRTRLNQYLSAGKVHLADDVELTLLQQRKTWRQWQRVFTEMLAPYEARDQVLAEMRAQAGELLRQIRQNVARNRAYVIAFGDALQGHFGTNHPTLKSFGIITRQPKKPSVKTQAAAVVARRNTRLERGTMGKRQRSRVKGGRARLSIQRPVGKPE